MKAIRIKAYQETACYTKPFANKVTETYPLPPYSTVKGMIHALLNANEFIPMLLSIQGDYESFIIDYKKTYSFKKQDFNMPIIMDGLPVKAPKFENMESMPLYTHMLFNVELVIHLSAEDATLQNIYRAFHERDVHLSLGRQEDLLRIDEISIVNLDELDLFEGAYLKHSMYIPSSYIYEEERKKGIPYLLNWKYKIKKGIREWEQIPTTYVLKNQLIDEDFLCNPAYIDNEGYIVIWHQ